MPDRRPVDLRPSDIDQPFQVPMRANIEGPRRNPSTDQRKARRRIRRSGGLDLGDMTHGQVREFTLDPRAKHRVRVEYQAEMGKARRARKGQWDVTFPDGSTQTFAHGDEPDGGHFSAADAERAITRHLIKFRATGARPETTCPSCNMKTPRATVGATTCEHCGKLFADYPRSETAEFNRAADETERRLREGKTAGRISGDRYILSGPESPFMRGEQALAAGEVVIPAGTVCEIVDGPISTERGTYIVVLTPDNMEYTLDLDEAEQAVDYGEEMAGGTTMGRRAMTRQASVVVVQPYAPKDNQQYHVHGAGCKDLQRNKYRMEDAWEMEHDNLSDIAQEVYPPDNFDYDPDEDKFYEGDFKVFPCAGLKPKTAELGEPTRTMCPNCGSAQLNAATGTCPQCGYQSAHAAEYGFTSASAHGTCPNCGSGQYNKKLKYCPQCGLNKSKESVVQHQADRDPNSIWAGSVVRDNETGNYHYVEGSDHGTKSVTTRDLHTGRQGPENLGLSWKRLTVVDPGPYSSYMDVPEHVFKGDKREGALDTSGQFVTVWTPRISTGTGLSGMYDGDPAIVAQGTWDECTQAWGLTLAANAPGTSTMSPTQYEASGFLANQGCAASLAVIGKGTIAIWRAEATPNIARTSAGENIPERVRQRTFENDNELIDWGRRRDHHFDPSSGQYPEDAPDDMIDWAQWRSTHPHHGKESGMTESELLRAMAAATDLDELRGLDEKLGALRAQQREVLRSGRDDRVADALIEQRLASVGTFDLSTVATDWLADPEPDPVAIADVQHVAIVEAAKWYAERSDATLDHVDELRTQMGSAVRRFASRFGEHAPIVTHSFVSEVNRLHMLAMHVHVAAGDKASATALLAAEGLDWSSPAADIDDVLLAAGWSDEDREGAIGQWLASLRTTAGTSPKGNEYEELDEARDGMSPYGEGTDCDVCGEPGTKDDPIVRAPISPNGGNVIVHRSHVDKAFYSSRAIPLAAQSAGVGINTALARTATRAGATVSRVDFGEFMFEGAWDNTEGMSETSDDDEGDDNDESDSLAIMPTCSACGGASTKLGRLGTVDWYRCASCATDFSAVATAVTAADWKTVTVEADTLDDAAAKVRAAHDVGTMGQQRKVGDGKVEVKFLPSKTSANAGWREIDDPFHGTLDDEGLVKTHHLDHPSDTSQNAEVYAFNNGNHAWAHYTGGAIKDSSDDGTLTEEQAKQAAEHSLLGRRASLHTAAAEVYDTGNGWSIRFPNNTEHGTFDNEADARTYLADYEQGHQFTMPEPGTVSTGWETGQPWQPKPGTPRPTGSRTAERQVLQHERLEGLKAEMEKHYGPLEYVRNEGGMAVGTDNFTRTLRSGDGTEHKMDKDHGRDVWYHVKTSSRTADMGMADPSGQAVSGLPPNVSPNQVPPAFPWTMPDADPNMSGPTPGPAQTSATRRTAVSRDDIHAGRGEWHNMTWRDSEGAERSGRMMPRHDAAQGTYRFTEGGGMGMEYFIRPEDVVSLERTAARTAATETLTCDMKKGCTNPVTHIDNKGWVYCTQHGENRKASVPTRKMTKAEISTLQNGGTINYRRASVEADYKYVKQHGDKWVITQKGTGKVLSTHDSEEKAKAAFRAMETHMHGGSLHTAEADPSGEGVSALPVGIDPSAVPPAFPWVLDDGEALDDDDGAISAMYPPNNADGYTSSRTASKACPYCGDVDTHLGSARTANGADVTRFDRIHRNEAGWRPGGPTVKSTKKSTRVAVVPGPQRQKAARELAPGDKLVNAGEGYTRDRPSTYGATVSHVDTTSSPGQVYVWHSGKKPTDGPADITYSHGDPVKVHASQRLAEADQSGESVSGLPAGVDPAAVPEAFPWTMQPDPPHGGVITPLGPADVAGVPMPYEGDDMSGNFGPTGWIGSRRTSGATYTVEAPVEPDHENPNRHYVIRTSGEDDTRHSPGDRQMVGIHDSREEAEEFARRARESGL